MQKFLKSCVAHLLPKEAQVWLRREILARKVAHGFIDLESELRPIRRLVSPGDTVIDIGANAGAFSIPFASFVGESGVVVALEPIPETFEVLQLSARLSGAVNIRALRLAASDRAGTAEFTVPKLDGFRGYYRAHLSVAGEDGTRVPVALETLDSLRARGDFGRPAFIKCDVEGHELAVLRGYEEFVEVDRPAWYLEVCEETGREVFEWLESRGYSAWAWENDSFHPARFCADRDSPNYFFLHRHDARARRF